jgi:hypothetical protein
MAAGLSDRSPTGYPLGIGIGAAAPAGRRPTGSGCISAPQEPKYDQCYQYAEVRLPGSETPLIRWRDRFNRTTCWWNHRHQTTALAIPLRLFDDPPTCWLHRQASFILLLPEDDCG